MVSADGGASPAAGAANRPGRSGRRTSRRLSCDSEMTDSSDRPADEPPGIEQRPGKRDRLVAAAVQLLHQQRHRAHDAGRDRPAGQRAGWQRLLLLQDQGRRDRRRRRCPCRPDQVDSRGDRRAPPNAESPAEGVCAGICRQSEIVAQYGCPLGSLCSEIDKRLDAPDFAVAALMRLHHRLGRSAISCSRTG